MKYFDTHAHYYDARFLSEECTGGVDALLDALFSSSVLAVINVGTNPETCRAAIRQAKFRPYMATALGIHPTDAQELSDLPAALSEVEGMTRVKENKCIALGEIGLDYHYPDTDRALQWEVFDAQMTMAERLGLPVVIHDRDAHGDTMTMIRKHPAVRGVLHSFSGSAEMAKELLSFDYMISFSGTLTFKNARKPREAAAVLPRDRILIETDAPYLAPHPLRGTLNHSGNLTYINAALAAVLGISPEACASLTAENAMRFFGIPSLPFSV